MTEEKLWEWLVSAIGLISAIATFMFRKLWIKVEEIEKEALTKTEFKEAWQGLREDRRLLHAENREALRRIEEKIDEAEGKNSNHRHSMNNELQKLVAETAVVKSKVEDLRQKKAP